MTLDLFVAFLLVLFAAHWFGDFVLQNDDMAKRKSRDFDALISHVVVYSLPLLAWTVLVIACLRPGALFWWWYPINVAAHGVIDYYTSRWTARLRAQGESARHNFFVVIGFDQLLHTITLIGTFYLLTR